MAFADIELRDNGASAFDIALSSGPQSGTVAETASATDAQSAQVNFQSARAESVTAAETQSGARTIADARAESASATETQNRTKHVFVALAEGLNLGDSHQTLTTGSPVAGGSKSAQCFTATASGWLCRASFTLATSSGPTGNGYARLYYTTGTVGSTAIPTGSPLASSASIDVSTIAESPAWYAFDFLAPFYIEQGTDYAIAFERDAGAGQVSIRLTADTVAHPGNRAAGTTSYTAIPTQDQGFIIGYGASEETLGAATMGVSVAESASATDAQDAQLTAAVARAESASALDAQDANFAVVGAVAESVTADETQSAQLTAMAARAEVASASDAQDADIAEMSGTVAESVSATETQSASAIFAAARAEAANALDTQITGEFALREESASASDAQSASAIFAASRSESAAATDAQSAAQVFARAVAETANALDSTNGQFGQIYDVSIAEVASANDSLDAAFEYQQIGPTGPPARMPRRIPPDVDAIGHLICEPARVRAVIEVDSDERNLRAANSEAMILLAA